LQFTKKFL